ncbi:energy-coupling factor ABC transporter permease [Pengzhenrongella frigida]|uniref:Cobalt ABC transporter permease n=1 Tax=Pengzhenrongella frigida TaxID=1259133 RepID=A0A4Q5N076_9MICO|nr:energy-coupling factor ABC transporter permease [Cellulomonas sp. HLT2-17]RYV51415.1 cobalt ABC transporter permease [Cellulomonas sp. HLT2-17]
MHTPEHFVSQPTSVATAALAAGALLVAVRRARGELLSPNPDGQRVDVRTRVAMTASVTALIFATQMLNFPVAAGTSGHLLGGALAAVLLGPWLGLLSITLVLTVQAVVFADGGLQSLGVNVALIGVVGVGAAWLVLRALLRRHDGQGNRGQRDDGRNAVARAAAVGGLVSVVAAAAGLVALYAVGGMAQVPLGSLAGQMVGWHLLIGLGEALLTGLLVAAVMAVNPNLVFAARWTGSPTPARASARVGVVAVATTAGIVAVALARFASPSPDGLAFVSQHLGLEVAAGAEVMSGAWLAGYGAASGIDVGLAGLVGVVLVAAAGGGLAALIARTSSASGEGAAVSPS